jgi:hypothetical protein
MRRTVNFDAAQTLLIDALQGENFAVRMGTSIEQLLIKNVSPGQLYVFILTQDETGGRTVTWGTQALNGSPPDPAPQSITVQSFIGTAQGSLEANLAATWSE